MKAVVCRRHGGPELARLEEVDEPAMIAGGVRIRVRATAASFASLLVMRGRHQNRAPLPLTPGTEVAGEVIEADRSRRFRPGDRVVAGVRSGGYAEQVVAPAGSVFPLPAGIDFDSGSHFPTVYATAYAALKWRARLRAGETVLVHGAAGGSGLAAVQVARAMGARVIATAGGDAKTAALRAQGVDAAIDHRAGDWRAAVLEMTGGRGADVIYDPVGGETFAQSLRCIAPEGRLIPMGFAGGTIPSVPANIVLVRNISVIGLYWGDYVGWGRQAPPASTGRRVRRAFAELFDWTLAGRIRPLTHRTLPLSEFRQALDLITSREVIGRVVMRPGT